MAYERSSLRYAHTTGHSSLIYTTDDENFILTCGSDGDIRKWRSIDDDDPSSNCLGEFVLCLAYSDGRLLASTDRNTLQAYTFPAIDIDGTLLRFTAPVTCISVNGKYTAAGSDDTVIKVLRTGGSEVHLQGHSGPILALDVCASKDMLASIGGDGVLKIWSLEGEEGAELKSISGLPKVNSFESAVCFGTPTFEPLQGQSLAYARGKDIYVLNTATWEVQYTLTDERIGASSLYTCCQFSKDGQYLAAGTSVGELSIFDFRRKQPLRCEAPASDCGAITGIAWHPTNNKELAYCDATGQLGTIFAGGAGGAGDGADAVESAEADLDFGDIEFDGGDDIAVGHQDDDDNEDDEDGTVSIERLKKKVMKAAYENGGNDPHHSDDDNSRDSVGARSSVHGKDIEVSEAIAQSFKQQAAFQPSATPSHLEHRYLVWNSVGIVSAHADSGTATGDGAIDVEFHDASVHHALHIPNYNNSHTMASLSASVLALSGGDDASKLVCIALAASGNKEWSLQMPDDECVVALAATTRLVAVATTNNFLRLFTVMGTQRELLSLPGPVLAMAGFSDEDRIIVVYHSAPASAKQQHLGALLLNAPPGMGNIRIQQLPLALPPGRQLSWLGFTDLGSPVLSDSMGLLQLFSTRNNCWLPICDTLQQRQSVSNNYFIIAVAERTQIVQAVLCRGCSYPMTNPRPMLQELPMRIPLCDADDDKTEQEDALLRASIMRGDGADRIVKETVIKLFSMACRSEIELRGKELIEMVARPDLLLLAVKYATKLGRIHLADRLSDLMPQMEEAAEQQKLEQTQALVAEALAASPAPFTAQRNPNTYSSSTSKLAPKAMELSASKRAPFKRFSMSNTPTASRLSATLATSISQVSSADTQENICESYNEQVAADELCSSASIPSSENTSENKSTTRTPLNSVNPFAAKRKLAAADFAHKGILLGSGKLKFAKK